LERIRKDAGIKRSRASKENSVNKERILIVNSDKSVCQMLADLLYQEYEVLVALTFKNALQLYKDESISTVITELDTEETKGIEVVTKFRSEKSDIPIIVVTTHNSVLLAVEAMKAGAYDYVTQPFNTDELKFIITHALERNKLQKEVNEKKIYQEMAITDSLTNIYNRRYFDELLLREEARAKRYPQKFSLLMIDLDDFKRINDIYGHPAGDNLLRDVAQVLLRHIRTTDFIARYGGDEFVVIAPHSSKNDASVFAARIMDIFLKEEFTVGDSTKIKITISIGVANFNEDAQNKEDLLKKADEALYQAKRLGKNRICLFGN